MSETSKSALEDRLEHLRLHTSKTLDDRVKATIAGDGAVESKPVRKGTVVRLGRSKTAVWKLGLAAAGVVFAAGPMYWLMRPSDVLAQTAELMKSVRAFHYEVTDLTSPDQPVREFWSHGDKTYCRLTMKDRVFGEAWINSARFVVFYKEKNRVVIKPTAAGLLMGLAEVHMVYDFKPSDWKTLPQKSIREGGRTWLVAEVSGTGTYSDGHGASGETRNRLWIDEKTALPDKLEGLLRTSPGAEWKPFMVFRFLWDKKEVPDDLFEPNYPANAKVTEEPGLEHGQKPGGGIGFDEMAPKVKELYAKFNSHDFAEIPAGARVVLDPKQEMQFNARYFSYEADAQGDPVAEGKLAFIADYGEFKTVIKAAEEDGSFVQKFTYGAPITYYYPYYQSTSGHWADSVITWNQKGQPHAVNDGKGPLLEPFMPFHPVIGVKLKKGQVFEWALEGASVQTRILGSQQIAGRNFIVFEHDVHQELDLARIGAPQLRGSGIPPVKRSVVERVFYDLALGLPTCSLITLTDTYSPEHLDPRYAPFIFGTRVPPAESPRTRNISIFQMFLK